jgi:hypothetical protein
MMSGRSDGEEQIRAADALFRERVHDAMADYWKAHGAPEGELPQIVSMLILQAKFGIKVHNWVLLGAFFIFGALAFIGVVAWSAFQNMLSGIGQ